MICSGYVFNKAIFFHINSKFLFLFLSTNNIQIIIIIIIARSNPSFFSGKQKTKTTKNNY